MSYSTFQLSKKINSLQNNINSLQSHLNDSINDLKKLNSNPFITITNPVLNASIFQPNLKAVLKINDGIDNIVIPDAMVEGQSIQFYNLSSNSVNIKCFVLAYNTFYSPKGTLNFIMNPFSVFTFHLLLDSTNNKLLIVN